MQQLFASKKCWSCLQFSSRPPQADDLKFPHCYQELREVKIQSPAKCSGCSLLWQNNTFLVVTVCVGWKKSRLLLCSEHSMALSVLGIHKRLLAVFEAFNPTHANTDYFFSSSVYPPLPEC